MALTLNDIDHIARMAQLSLTGAERDATLARLNAFFGIVETIRAVDTTGVEPLRHPTAVMNDVHLRLHDDIASEPEQRDANQQNAPAVADGLFLVPRVIE